MARKKKRRLTLTPRELRLREEREIVERPRERDERNAAAQAARDARRIEALETVPRCIDTRAT